MTDLVQNPLLSALKLPGRVFPVPSGCYFYKDGEVDESVLKTREVQVFSMSGLAEMKFRSPDLLYSGKAVCEVIKECIPSILKPEILMSKDVDSLLAYIRLVTYGPSMEIKSKHTCKDAKEHSYEINLESMITGTHVLSKDEHELKFTIKLSNDQIVQLHSLTWEDSVNLLQMSSNNELSNQEIDDIYVKNYLGLIVAIDGITDRKMIDEWLRLAPAPYTNQIKEAVTSGLEQWGTDFDAKIKCRDCGENYSFELDLNPSSFFSQ